MRRGFTEFVGHYNGAIDYFTHQREGELDWHRGYDSNYQKGYSTDLIADAAVQFINQHAGEGPFLCYVPFNAPHSPLQAKTEDLAQYQSLRDHGPGFRARTGKRGVYGSRGRGQSRRQTLAAMISSMDQGVGRILNALDSNRISDKTLVWLLSDNGGVPPGDNRPLNGKKGTVYEGGIRVVAAVRWPGVVPAGTTVETPLAYIDILPTLMRITSVRSHGGKPLDGIDARDLLTGARTSHARDVYSYIGQGGEANEQIALVEPEWKLIVIGTRITDQSIPRSRRQVLLFRISSDPYESRDLADQHPQVVSRMWDKLAKFRSLQPATAVPAYRDRGDPFVPPPEWKIPDK